VGSLKIVVAGYVAQFPVAGFFWHPVSFALGFRALGHDVWFLEDSGEKPYGWDIERDRPDPECRAGVRFLEREMRDVGLPDRWVFRHMPTGRHHGMDAETTAAVLADADVFVNVSCTTSMRPEYRRIPHRIAIDTDPVFTQVRIARGELADVPGEHTRLFTFGRPPLPGQRHEWLPTRQPVALEHWPQPGPPPQDSPFATLTTSWEGEYPVEWGGVEYGGKERSFIEYMDLPSLAGIPLRVALGGKQDGVAGALLRDHGWEVSDARTASGTSADYRSFIAASAGEFGLAQGAYVTARSGWFSERTACFLASGRPAVVQETGFSDWLPTGEGLLSYSTPAGAARALETVVADWPRHADAARALAADHFEAASVCGELLEAAL
jgi:hypothetical protein